MKKLIAFVCATIFGVATNAAVNFTAPTPLFNNCSIPINLYQYTAGSGTSFYVQILTYDWQIILGTMDNFTWLFYNNSTQQPSTARVSGSGSLDNDNFVGCQISQCRISAPDSPDPRPSAVIECRNVNTQTDVNIPLTE